MNSLQPPGSLTLDEYYELDEDVRRDIEITDGVILRREQRSRAHQKTASRLGNALELQIAKFRREHKGEHAPCYEVNTEVDVVLWEVPLTLRKPDVVIHHCIDPFDQLTAADTVLVVEVVSRTSNSRDRIHKMGEYSKARIPHYLIVEFDAMGALTIEHYALLGQNLTYSPITVTHRDRDIFALKLTDPFRVEIGWQELDIAPLT
ncbi:Uma2 family endonuclease [Actinomadura adrarensis]|uniref:Uma2 family endonuclease n=1 Tax=Actinomadura adrarensis TaxID=1819600 RepID=A0ABW3CPV1_9ACTN